MATVAMPQLGESVTEGTIGRWLKQPGEAVEKYEPLVEVTTDKVNAEIPSPFAGVLQEIMAQEGETVNVGAQIAVIAAAGEGKSASAPPGDGVEAVPDPAPVTNQAGGEAGGPVQAAAVASTAQAASPTDETLRADNAREGAGQASASQAGSGATLDTPGGRRRFTPLVLRLAEQHGIALAELGQITGTKLGGRVGKDDLLHYLEQRDAAPAAARPEPSTPPPVLAEAATTPPPLAAPGRAAPSPRPATAGEVVPWTPMRKAIAAHMVRSLATAPHAWTMVEVDMTAVARYRAAKKDEFARREGFSLSFVPFFIEAVVGALQAYPVLNATYSDEGIALQRAINIGVAVALENQQGLVVPVIKGADERNLVGLARAVNDLATRARGGKLTPDDLAGGTFTVNNPGTFGSILSQPIINQPQAAIVTMEAISKRPVVVSGEDGDSIAIRAMLNVCLSFDHRLLDGLTAGQFLAEIKRRLEGFTGSAGL